MANMHIVMNMLYERMFFISKTSFLWNQRWKWVGKSSTWLGYSLQSFRRDSFTARTCVRHQPRL